MGVVVSLSVSTDTALPFLLERSMREAFAKMMKRLKKSHTPEALEVVRRAYRVADQAHHNQLRASGDPYILHLIEVATIIASLGLDPEVCAAALLHDVVEDTDYTVEMVKKEQEWGSDFLQLKRNCRKYWEEKSI